MIKFVLMKIILTISLLSLRLSFAQLSQVAVITNPEIGPENNAKNLIEIVDDINRRKNVLFTAVIGNITAGGKIDEFVWAQEILDGLTVPYFVIGGEKDYYLSETPGYEMELIWGDDKNLFIADNFSIICLNTILPGFRNNKHLSAETITWLNENFSSLQDKNVFVLSYFPLSSTDNSRIFYEAAFNHNLFSIVGKVISSDKDSRSIEGLYQNRKDGWGYYLVSAKGDSLYLQKMLSSEIKKKTKPETIRLKFTPSFLYESREPDKYLFPGKTFWTVKLKSSINFSPGVKSGKIFAANKNGQVICLNKYGKEEWRYESGQRINYAPIADTNLLLTSTTEGDILTIDLTTGSPFQVIGTGDNISSGIALIDIEESGIRTKGIAAGTEFGNLYCYNLLSLEPIWTKELTSGSIVPPIIFSGNKIFYRNNEGMLYCRSAASGSLIWQYAAGFLSRQNRSSLPEKDILVKDNDIYLTDDAGSLFCIDALLGTKKWELRNIKGNGLIRLYKQGLALSTINNKIVIVSPVAGKVVKEYILPSDLQNHSITDLTVIDEKLVTGFSNGWVCRTDSNGQTKKIFRGGYAPVISILNFEGSCLITDYDGSITLLNITDNPE